MRYAASPMRPWECSAASAPGSRTRAPRSPRSPTSYSAPARSPWSPSTPTNSRSGGDGCRKNWGGATSTARPCARARGPPPQASDQCNTPPRGGPPPSPEVPATLLAPRPPTMAALPADNPPEWRERMQKDLVRDIEHGMTLTAREIARSEALRSVQGLTAGDLARGQRHAVLDVPHQ